MLTVDVTKRYTIDDCLAHPWTTQSMPNPNDSTDGLVGGIGGLDFSSRKLARERTLLSSINEVKVTRVIEIEHDKQPVKVYIKNPTGKPNKVNKSGVHDTPKGVKSGGPKHEVTPSKNRNPDEFMELGGKGDQDLFDLQEDSIYSKDEAAKKKK